MNIISITTNNLGDIYGLATDGKVYYYQRGEWILLE